MRLFAIISVALLMSACGVRGRPQPPLTPPELGRGQPTFRRATEEFAFPNVPGVESQPNKKNEDGKDEQEKE